MVSIESNKNSQVNNILKLDFNQDSSCFSIASDIGFRVINTEPFKDHFERVLDNGIGICKVLFRTNIILLVGGGKNPKFSPNKLMIWDDNLGKVISEMRFNSNIINVLLKRNKVMVILELKTYLFDFPSFTCIDIIDTYDNTKGIGSLTLDPEVFSVAYPEKTQGTVRIKFYDKEYSQVIHAHESNIAFLAMNYNGSLLATASDRGTIIRLFNTYEGVFLQEMRRGSEKAIIYSISFNISSTLLAISSDRGTVHIYNLTDLNKKQKETQSFNKKEEEEKVSIIDKISHIIPIKMFTNEWSFAQLRLPADVKSICAFSSINDNVIFVATYDGKFYTSEVDPIKGGECKKKEYSLFNKL